MEICSRLVLLVLAWIFSITDVMTVNKVAGISRTCFKTLQRTKALPSFDDDDLRNTTERLDRFLSCQIPVRISCFFFFTESVVFTCPSGQVLIFSVHVLDLLRKRILT